MNHITIWELGWGRKVGREETMEGGKDERDKQLHFKITLKHENSVFS